MPYKASFFVRMEMAGAKKENPLNNQRVSCGERGSRTYEIIENHKISISCKLSVYKIVKFIETHRAHFDI